MNELYLFFKIIFMKVGKLVSKVAALLCIASNSFAQTPINMASLPSGTLNENFSTIGSWTPITVLSTTDPIGGTFPAATAGSGAAWVIKRANGTGTTPLATLVTQSTSSNAPANYGFNFQTITGTGGGITRVTTAGSEALAMLATGTDFTNSAAIDLNLDFSGRNAGTISFDMSAIANNTSNTGPRDAAFTIYASTDCNTWVELQGCRDTVTNGSTTAPYSAIATAARPSIVNVQLPAFFDNCKTAKLRFYAYPCPSKALVNSGNRPRIVLDNLVITSTAPVCNTPITTTASANLTQICAGQLVNLTASSSDPNASYIWSASTSGAVSGLPLCANSSSYFVAPSATTTYTLSASSGSCYATSTITVVVNPSPTISISPVNSTVCAGGSQALTLTSSGAVSINWLDSTELSFTSATDAISTPTMNHTYQVVAVNAFGCAQNTSAIVNFIASAVPVISAATSTTLACVGSSVALTASGAVSYNWSPSAGLSSVTSANVVANPTSTTIYTVTGTAGACVGSTTIEIIANNNPLPSIAFTTASPVSVCPGIPASLVISGTDTYNWVPSSSLNSATGATVLASPTSNTIYTVTATTAAGCTSTASYTLNLFANAAINAAVQPIKVCTGGMANLVANGGATYLWSNGMTGSPTITPTGVTNYTVTGTDVNGCTGTSVTSVETTTNGAIAYYSMQTSPNGIVDSVVECVPFVSAASAIVAGNQNSIPAAQFVSGTGANTFALQTATGAGSINAGMICKISVIDPAISTYVEMTITPVAGQIIKLDAIRFANRSTSTGPQVLNFRSSADNFASNIATLPVSNGAIWQQFDVALGGVNAGASTPITLRIYGTNGSGTVGTGANWRIDDIKLCMSPLSLCNTPTLTVTGNTSTCANNPTTLSATGASTIYWETPAFVDSNANTTFTGTMSATYTVVGSNGPGCSTSSLVQISVLPTLTSFANYTICASQLPFTVGTQVYNGAGVYNATYTSSLGCDSVEQTTITVSTIDFSITGILKSNTLCANSNTGSFSVATIGAPVSFTVGATNNSTGFFNNLAAGTYTVSVANAAGCSISTMISIGSSAPIQFATPTVLMPSTCAISSGSVSCSAIGGTNPKTYMLLPQSITNGSGTFTNLAAGAYTIISTDANACSESTVVSVSAQTAPSIVLNNIQNVTCFGRNNGQVGVVASGNSGPYLFTISPAATQTSSGSFSAMPANVYTLVTKDASNCTYTTLVTITSPAAMTMNFVVQSPTCNGLPNGSLAAVVNGGIAPYTYVLTSSAASANTIGVFAPLGTGIYSVKATDNNGCTIVKSALMPQPSAVKISSISTTKITCNGQMNGSISAVLSGGMGAKTLSINPNIGSVAGATISGLPANTYTLMATDANACTRTTTVVLTQPSAISFSSLATTPPTGSSSNGSIGVAAIGGTGAKQYAIGPAFTFGVSGTFSGLASGVYTIQAKDASNCSISTIVNLGTTVSKAIQNSTIIEANAANEPDHKLIVYPNPAIDVLHFAATRESSIKKVAVRDISGRSLLSAVAVSSIQVDKLKTGMYYLEVEFVDGNIDRALFKKD